MVRREKSSLIPFASRAGPLQRRIDRRGLDGSGMATLEQAGLDRCRSHYPGRSAGFDLFSHRQPFSTIPEADVLPAARKLAVQKARARVRHRKLPCWLRLPIAGLHGPDVLLFRYSERLPCDRRLHRRLGRRAPAVRHSRGVSCQTEPGRRLQAASAYPRSRNGRWRTRSPVAVKIALPSAGASAGKAGSPIPVGGLSDWMK